MLFDESVLDETEKIIYALRALYLRYGYSLYRMSKFEEYDLYSRNKDFLVSDAVITFTDTDGKLMALKPDVTLSIIKNDREEGDTLRKLCYNENVYRIAKGSGSFKEIMQTGLECIGTIDEACLAEVLKLALLSLGTISKNTVLEVSDLDILSYFIDAVDERKEVRRALMILCGNRNEHGIREELKKNDIPESKAEPLFRLLKLFGTPEQVFPELFRLTENTEVRDEVFRLKTSLESLKDTQGYQHILVDFSVTGDMNYYNGIIFKGFIAGIPESVLSGGQYDRLMRKMNRKSQAVGFAVYLDLLERLDGLNERMER